MIILAVATAPVAAQVALPPIIPTVDGTVRGLTGTVDAVAADVVRTATQLAQARIDRIDLLVRRNPRAIERDATGNPARRGEVLISDPDDAAIAAATATGFRLIERGEIEGVGLGFARLAVPNGLTLAKAERLLRARLPGVAVSADPLLFGSGAARAATAPTPADALPGGGTAGLIDSGVDARVPVAQHRGFAAGAPLPAAHGTAVASLLASAGVTRIIAADVYGNDPAGGSALAVARALGWMTALRVPVVNISLAGPDNPLLARTIAAAGARGMIVVAAVGNDGPAAPPAYPASYPSVVAVTAVDGRNRALIEAGRALHLDYAAPGADMVATGLNGKAVRVRGTSFATPLVAARIAAAYKRASDRIALMRMIDATAVDLGRKGPDAIYGRGLVCGECRRVR